MRKWSEGKEVELWHDALKISKTLVRKKAAKHNPNIQHEANFTEGEDISPELKANVAHCKRLLDDGQCARAAKALTSNGLDQVSNKAKLAMADKHPQASSITIPEEGMDAPPVRVTTSTVRSSIKSFKPGSAPGPSGLRGEHLREAILAPASHLASKALESITRLVNFLLEGKLPKSMVPYFCGARLLVAVKKQGGFRPIAVRNILRRLTSKCLMSPVLRRL